MTAGRAPWPAAPFAATPEMPPPGRDRVVLFLGIALSLALHGALVAAAATLRAAPAPTDQPVEIVFLELPPRGLVVPLVAPRPERPQPPAQPRRPAVLRPRGDGARDPRGAEGPPPSAAGAAAADASSWLFAPKRREARGLGLAPREVARLGGSSAASGSHGGEVVKDAEPAPRSLGQRVQAMVDEARAAYQAEAPDAYWTPVRDRMSERFVPSWAVYDAEGGSKATSIRNVISGYLDAAGRYGRAETSGGHARPSPGSDPRETANAPLDDRNPFFRELVVLVRVEQRLDGTLERVEFVQSCGYRELDRMALEAARAAVEGRAAIATPPQGRRTLWAFTAHYEVIPPAPVVGCPLDAIWTADFGRCAWPLKRTASARVELRGID